jgi:hypothetical protein
MTQTQCTHCERSLRIEIISPYPNFKYKISKMNNTTCYGGLFCSSHCAMRYIEKIENMLHAYKFKMKEVKMVQRWWIRLTS